MKRESSPHHFNSSEAWINENPDLFDGMEWTAELIALRRRWSDYTSMIDDFVTIAQKMIEERNLDEEAMVFLMMRMDMENHLLWEDLIPELEVLVGEIQWVQKVDRAFLEQEAAKKLSADWQEAETAIATKVALLIDNGDLPPDFVLEETIKEKLVIQVLKLKSRYRKVLQEWLTDPKPQNKAVVFKYHFQLYMLVYEELQPFFNK